MRYGIFSDVHANLEALEAVIQAFQNEFIDQSLCVGDVVGYAANPRECIEKVRALAMITVAGNHDWASTDLFSLDYFNPQAAKAIVWTKEKLDDPSRYFLESLKPIYKNADLTLAHGTLDNPADFHYLTDSYSVRQTFALLETPIGFVGHTHIPGVFVEDEGKHIYYCRDDAVHIEEKNRYIINVGSVGQPRDGNSAAIYCIYDTDQKIAWIKRVNYDFEITRNKIINAGLPRFLAERLVIGK